MKNRSLLTVLGLAFFSFTHTSCLQEYFNYDKMAHDNKWNPNLAVPLTYASLTLDDILVNSSQENIRKGSDNLVSLVYKSDLISKKAEDIFRIPDLSASHSYSLSAADVTAINALAVGATYAIPSIVIPVDFNPGGSGNSKLDSILFKKLTDRISLVSNINQSATVTVKIPGAKKAGVAFTKPVSLAPFASSVTTDDLSGYQFNLTHGGGQNKFSIQLDITLTKGSGTVSTANGFSFNTNLTEAQFRVMFGYIKEDQLSPLSDTNEVKFFKNAYGVPRFTLVDPKCWFRVKNSFGVPVKADIIQLDGINLFQGTNSTVNLGYTLPLNIPGATIATMGSEVSTDIIINSTNSNIVEFVNRQPKDVVYKLSSSTTPTSNANFALDTSRFKVEFEVELPMHGTAEGITFIDTVLFNGFDQVSDDVESALVRLYTNNGFPCDVMVEVAFADGNGSTLDYLVKKGTMILQSSPIDGAGRATGQTERTTDIPVDRPTIDRVRNTKFLIIKATANTANNGATNVRFFSTNMLDIKIGVQTKLNINF